MFQYYATLQLKTHDCFGTCHRI